MEQLEARLALAALEFDTALASLNLTGGPYAMPLASDPGNALGDSVDGYGWVDTNVAITLSSQRPPTATPPGPGPASIGKACANSFGGEAAAAEAGQGCNREGGPAPPLEPIDPNELDGQQFFVDSFFDVFFDITVTDVDPRLGRDFAGMPDGATILLPNNGPASMESIYTAVFDKDAPNFGLVPPPEVGPYIGHFNIEIPLGGDLNGNGENDKIKFTLAAHAVGDENRTFIQLPDGTVLDEFDSAANLEGAIVDESSDPPFTLGAGTPGAPSFSGPGALTGPTTASSMLLNPLAKPAFSYVDVDNDHAFTVGTDVALINGETADGKFDTRKAEGGYNPRVLGAGLYLGGAPISARKIEFKADRDIVVDTNLTATDNGGGDIKVESRTEDVVLDDPALNAARDVVIEAEGDIISSDDSIGAGRDVKLEADGSIGLLRTPVTAGRDIKLDGSDVDVSESTLGAGRDVRIEADNALFAVMAVIGAGRDIELDSDGDVDGNSAKLTAGRDIEVEADGNITLNSATLLAGRDIEVEADDDVSLLAAELTAGRQICVEGDKVFRDALTTLTAPKVKVKQRNP